MSEQHTTTFHRPSTEDYERFTIWTEDHRKIAHALPPCAYHLWQWLLEKAAGGVEQEIDLEEIRLKISEGRAKPYCLQSLKNALHDHLVPRGLVEITRQYTRRIFKVVASHVGHVQVFLKKIGEAARKIAKTQINLSQLKFSFKTEAEIRAQRGFDLQIDQDISKSTTATNLESTAAAVVEKEVIEEPIQPATVQIPVPAPSSTPKLEPKLSSAAPTPNPIELFGSQLQKIKADLNDTLISELKRWQSQPVRIANAIDYVQEQIAARWVMNPTGLLIKSLREERKPRRVQSTVPVEVDYSTHPMAQQWLAEIREDAPVWVLKAPKEERDERRKFFEWAKGELLKEGIHVNPR